MNRSTAVQRISDGLGFMASGNALEQKIILRLQEAQRDLEKGKTLPRFLIREDQTLALVAGASTVALPSDFLRIDDEALPHYTGEDSDIPVFLRQRSYEPAVAAYSRTVEEALAPKVFVLRKTVLDFIYPADTDYTLYWNYFAKATTLETDIENAWLEFAPEWLIGEAGQRIALDARDTTAYQLFGEMAKKGRAAVFGEELVQETAGGPMQMGADL